MTKLGPAYDRADGLDLAVGDVDAEHADQAAVGCEDERSRLAVDLGRPDRPLHVPQLVANRSQKPGNVLAADDGPAPGWPDSAVVTVHLDVGGQQVEEAAHLAISHRGKEALGQLVACTRRHIEPRPPGLEMLPSPAGQLAAGG